MIILTTIQYINVGKNIFREKILGVQYFKNNQEDDVQDFCYVANKYWKKMLPSVECHYETID